MKKIENLKLASGGCKTFIQRELYKKSGGFRLRDTYKVYEVLYCPRASGGWEQVAKSFVRYH